MANGVYKITEEFEKALSDYTGAPYVVTLDNQSNGLFLALYYENNVKKRIKSKYIKIPSRTYPSVPCEIIHAGLKVEFEPVEGTTIKGAYQLKNSNVWDSALTFTGDMYIPGTHMCISFTGPYKHFKLSKGGAKIEVSKNWIKVDLFNDRNFVKLGDFELDLDILKDDEIETYLYKFYEAQYTKAGFKVEAKQ